MRSIFRVLLRLLIIAGIMATVIFVPQQVAWSAPETRSEDLKIKPNEEAKISFPATHVGVSWDGEADAAVEVRGAQGNDAWGPWIAVEAHSESGERPSGIVLLDDAKSVEVRVVSGNVANLQARAIDTENGPRRLEVTDNSAKASAAAAQPNIISRSGWGANEAMRNGAPSFADINKVVVHHTDTANNDPNPAATVRAIYDWHVNGNGWSDIGYNFLIDQQGRIYEGRYSGRITGENAAGQGVIGSHASGQNTGTVGVSLLGTFTNQAPTAAQREALERLIAWKGDRNNLNVASPSVVVGHRDMGQTTCPGGVAYGMLPQIRAAANGMRGSAAPVTPNLNANPGNTPGYWIAAADGRVLPFGNAPNKGSMAGKQLNGEITSMSRTTSGNGYWLMGTDGGIFTFGDARFQGSMGGKRLNQPIVGLAPTPSGNGYWLVGRDGGIFAFGDARFFGSMGGKRLNQPIVGMAPTPSGNGYWMVASDGGIFAFGDATFKGSTGGMKLAQPIMSMAPAANGSGYWLMAKDGGVFAFGTQFFGSLPMLQPKGFQGAVQAAATKTSAGYYMLSANGGVYSFGDARFHGAATDNIKAAAIVLTPAP